MLHLLYFNVYLLVGQTETRHRVHIMTDADEALGTIYITLSLIRHSLRVKQCLSFNLVQKLRYLDVYLQFDSKNPSAHAKNCRRCR